MHPGLADLFDPPSHADRVNPGRRRQRADRDRNVVTAAVGIDHIGEQEGAPRVLGEAALELPAHQRMQLGVFVDLPLDPHQQPRGFEPRQMLLEIERRATTRHHRACPGDPDRWEMKVQVASVGPGQARS